MKLPEPHRIVQGFGMEAEYLYTREQMREALAQHEAVMRTALAQLEINRTNFRKGPSKSICKMLAGGNDDAIEALEEQLK